MNSEEPLLDFMASIGKDSSINQRATQKSIMHDTLSRKEIDQSLLTLDDRIMNADEFVEFALSQKTVNIVDKVDDKLENLKQFLDLLRMRLSIQEDFTFGGIVTLFDPKKKGYITADDLKRADDL